VLGLPTPNQTTLDSYLGGFDVLWEIDLWGRIRRQNEAARAGLLASQETQRGVRLTLLSEVALAYIQLLELDERLEIAQRTEKSFERTFKLFDDQHKSGFASKLEVSRASAALHSVSAAIPDLRRQIALKENEINVLIGQTHPVAREKILLTQETLPEVPTGLPAMLLQRRPDIRAAEQQLRAANAGSVSRLEISSQVRFDRAVWRRQHRTLSPDLRWANACRWRPLPPDRFSKVAASRLAITKPSPRARRPNLLTNKRR